MEIKYQVDEKSVYRYGIDIPSHTLKFCEILCIQLYNPFYIPRKCTNTTDFFIFIMLILVKQSLILLFYETESK